jgi:acyl-CoA synthetase (AMP-forming)/AMP-acid ligase II
MLPVFALFNPALGLTTVVPEMNPSRPATVDPAVIVQAITQGGVTNSFGSPVLWRKVVDHCLARRITLPSLRRVLCAGAPVPPPLMADFRKVAPQATMYSPYGATEALPVATVSDREILESAAARTAAGAGTCVGRPVPGVDVRVIRLDDEPIREWSDDLVLPVGEIGEIVVRGAQVTREYDHLPEATAAAKIPDPRATRHPAPGTSPVWHRMGDCGSFDAEGRLWFCGRKAERVRTAHGDMFTERCEPVFNQHPAVARCALIGLGAPGTQEPAIVVETKPGATVTAAELRSLGRACPTTRDITAFFFHPGLPVDVRHNAKIHRLALARQFAGKQPERVP